MELKPDAGQIRSYMRGLASSLRLDPSRRWWTNWLFRSDHVENAAAILNSGKLLSRSSAEIHGLIKHDSGSPQYINHLSTQHRSYVRLYFRPRTPTQYSNEGIRPKSAIQYDAHMPVPVYMLFSISLLTRQGVSFTPGRLTETVSVGDSVEFLKSIEFSSVYHDGPVGRLGELAQRSSILNARHAEVLVPHELPLDHLKHIVCRSAPERDTLLKLLTPDVRDKWIERVCVDEGRRRLFYRRGTFVQHTDLSLDRTRFVFYSNMISSDMRGPFALEIEWTTPDDRRAIHKDPEFIVANHPKQFLLRRAMPAYKVKVTLNGDLAYLGEFDKDSALDDLF